MLSLEELQSILCPEKLALPKLPKVQEIKVEEYEDWTGDESLYVYVIVGDDTPEDESIWQLMKPIYERIREALERAGESRFVYTSVATRAEYDARNSYDPDADE